MRILLTGAQGYLGTVMSDYLTHRGHEVRGLDSGLFAGCVLGPQPVDPPMVMMDIRDVTPEHFTDIDAVIHLAALSNDPLGHLAPEITYDINFHASVRLAEAAKAAGVRHFLYSSTCSVYGAAGDSLVNEDAVLRPVTPYAESKVRVEEALIALADADFHPVSLRNATVFGFSPRLRADIVVNNLVGHAVTTNEITVLSDGTPWRPLVHVLDVAQAFAAILEADREAVRHHAYNVGWTQNNVTVAEVAQAVAEAVPAARMNITGEHGGDPRSYRVDFSRITTDIPAFDPQWTIRDGVDELVAAYRTFGLTQEAFASRFTRLAWLRQRIDAGEIDPQMRVLG